MTYFVRPTLLAVLSIILITASLFGQRPKKVSLKESIEIAQEQNFTIKQAQFSVRRDQAGVLSAYGNFLPTVSVGSSWSGGEQYVNGVALGGGGVRSFNPSLSARMTLFDGFSNTSSFSQATANASSSEYSFGRTRQQVTAQTQRLYYEVLRTQQLLEIAKLSLNYNAQQLERVRETARLGSASLVNVYQQQAQVGNDEVRVAQAQSDFDVAKANLAAYVALDVLDDYEFTDPSIPTELDSVEMTRQRESTRDLRTLASQAFERRLDYQSSKQSLIATEASVTIARSGYFPTISANASYGFNGRTVLETPLTSYSSEFTNFKDNQSLNWSLSLSLPIFSGFRTNEAIERATVTQRTAEEQFSETQRRIQVEIRSAILQLESAQKNYEAAMKSLQYQNQNLKVNQEKYNVGSGTLLDLLFAQNNYNSALTSKVNTVYQYLNAKSQLELALGTLQ
jgi:outer membrane protein